MSIVYWSHFSKIDNLPKMKLYNVVPKKMSYDLRKKAIVDDNGTYIQCPANHGFFHNMFYFEYPRDFSCNYDEKGNAIGEDSIFFRHRSNQFENQISVELDFAWLFFSPNPMRLQIMPPFFHKTKTQDFGVIAAGEFDIGRWFRPIHLSYFLWDGIKEFHASEKEPILYLKFENKEPVQLIEFNLNNFLFQTALACVNHPANYKDKLPLKLRYKKFEESSLRFDILKNIEENVVKK